MWWHSSDAAAVYRLAVIVGVVVVVLLARPVAGVRGEAPVRGGAQLCWLPGCYLLVGVWREVW